MATSEQEVKRLDLANPLTLWSDGDALQLQDPEHR